MAKTISTLLMVVLGGRFQQLVQQGNLFGGHLPGEHIRDQVDIGPLRQEMGGGQQVFGGGGGKGKGPGVFIDPQGHEGGLVRGQGDPLFFQQAGHDGHRSPHRPDDLQRTLQLPGYRRVMIVDMDVQVRTVDDFPEFPDPVRLAGVDQNQPFDPVQGDLLQLDEIIEVDGGLEKKITQILLLGAGEDQQGLRVEFFGGQHGGQSVEVGVQVRGDDLKASGFRDL